MDSRFSASPLKAGEAHLYLVNLDHFPADNEGWERLLSVEEVARSNRYLDDGDRLRFVARRGILRQLLGVYCGMNPAGIEYRSDPFGKLFIPSNPLSFNLSRSQDRIAFVFTLEKEAGVDIEQTRPLPELALLAKHYFSLDEQSALAALPQSLQLEAFYHIWTQKEAFIKAQGLGLRLPLADFSVTVDPDEPGSLKASKACPEDLSCWKIACFKPDIDYRVAVCVRAEKEIEFRMSNADFSDFAYLVSSGNTPHSV